MEKVKITIELKKEDVKALRLFVIPEAFNMPKTESEELLVFLQKLLLEAEEKVLLGGDSW